jgi:hypothetical protein
MLLPVRFLDYQYIINSNVTWSTPKYPRIMANKTPVT